MREDDLGPFKIGEVVLLTIDMPSLGRRAGDEVTVATEFKVHWANDMNGNGAYRAGWLLEEPCTAWPVAGRRMLAVHGEIKRKRPPAHPWVEEFARRVDEEILNKVGS